MIKTLWLAEAAIGAACLSQGYFLLHGRAALAAPAAPAAKEAQEPAWSSLEQRLRDRIAVSGITSERITTDKEIIISLKIPGLRPETLKIEIDDARITAVYVASAILDAAAGVQEAAAQGVRQFALFIPVPPNVDARKHRIIPDGGGFRIIFEKRDDPLLRF